MRYYGLILNSSTDKIKEKTKINLRDYDYESPIGAVNKYLHQNMVSTIRFLAYDEEDGNRIPAVFSYDENKHSFNDAYDYISNLLMDLFGIRIKGEPYEITSYQFYEAYAEATRRQFFYSYRLIEMTKIRFYENRNTDVSSDRYFDYNEKIINIASQRKNPIYDKSLANEISNIEAHGNTSEFTNNIVHYVISSRSMEAATDMTEALVTSLYKANRIQTRRISCFSNMGVNCYKSAVYIEEMIENNNGGVVVMDLSERFGTNPIGYKLVADYIVKLVKKYRNKCLFVFTYNMDKPGFAYSVLPNIKKYVIPVMLKEGSGDRKAAVSYMKMLVKASEYSPYAKQAGEFMKNYPADTFSQTDVLMAYEQFGPWCINKNIMKAYDHNVADEFFLDRDENEPSAQEKLDKMIGLKCVKEQIKSIIINNNMEKERKKYRKKASETNSMNMIFSGNPGSAKTTVAKLFAGIAKEKGLLKSGAFVECSGVSLSWFDVEMAFDAAKGGVIFIDEAYAIIDDSVITALLQEMENRRDEVIVILAGYNNRMKAFLEYNEGLKSRIPYWVDFPDYSTDELTEIFKLMLDERGFTATDDAIKEARYIFDKARLVDDFGNGRYVRNLVERAIESQSARLSETSDNISDISKEDLFLFTKQDISKAGAIKEERAVGEAMKELDDMIGLTSVKEVIKKAIAGAKLNKVCMERGIHKDKASLNMVFTGNPGTAKTTVARLLGEIMKDEQILPLGNFVEVGRADLVGQFVGSTAIKVKKKFKEARGGILFIDEAYSLCDNINGSYGDEAINTIVQEMENHREDTVVIFAGYPNEMKEFLNKNPGLSSRIAFQVNFDDYSTDELCEITKLMLSKKQMSITDSAMEKLKAGYDVVRGSNDYGNGRFVRKQLEESEMNLAERIFGMNESEISTQLLTTIEECDIPEVSKLKSETKKRVVGF